jgi:type II secretory ATPase GspE/PulE/Tfp pilus assembly ATPase PilB-like protein
LDNVVDHTKRERLGEILIRTEMVTVEQIQEALRIAGKENKLVGQVLVEQGTLTPRDLATALSIQLKVPLIDLRRHRVHREALSLVPESLARKHNVLPLDVIGGSLTLVMEDVNDVQAIDDVGMVTKMRIEPMMGYAEDIRKAIDRNYAVMGAVIDEFIEPSTLIQEEEEELPEHDDVYQTPALKHLNLMLQQAARSRASDIHIEPGDDGLHVRLRIDGVLQEVAPLPLTLHKALMSRIKILGGMNIAEQRRPQDGRFTAKVDGESIDIRVACGNTVHGEMAVLRLLPKSASYFDLTSLGFSPSAFERYEKMLKLPFGMILFGGPTGAGKTTTLYASISKLNSMERNIMTIEDPVEYQIAGINQFQVNLKAGLTFAEGLRSFVRLDPDVILVGEIRDSETVEIATQAALTGHLVLSSIHANDAVGILFRALDLGMQNYMICSAVVGSIAQRIARRICPHCKEPYEPAVEEKALYESVLGKIEGKLYQGAGCNLCANTGYLGRVGIFEVLTLSEEIKRLLIGNLSYDEIRAQAIKEGMVPMMHEGMLKVKAGITTISEVLRNLYSL